MPLTLAGRNKLLDSGKGGFTHIGALVDLAPSEPSGGSGATYARQPIAFATASGGIADNNAQIVIPIPGGMAGPVIAISAYDALTGGNMLAYGGIGSSLTKGVASVESIAGNVFQSNGNALANGERVMVFTVAGETLPAPLSATTLYYVITAATDSFQLSTSSGGAAVDISALGEFGWAKTVPETFASAGNLTIATGAYDLDMNFG